MCAFLCFFVGFSMRQRKVFLQFSLDYPFPPALLIIHSPYFTGLLAYLLRLVSLAYPVRIVGLVNLKV